MLPMNKQSKGPLVHIVKRGSMPWYCAWGIRLLALPGHKGLLGPQGTGALLFDDSVPLRPVSFGGTGTDSASPLPARQVAPSTIATHTDTRAIPAG